MKSLTAKSDVHVKRRTDRHADSLFSASVCMLRDRLVMAYTVNAACSVALPHSLCELI